MELLNHFYIVHKEDSVKKYQEDLKEHKALEKILSSVKKTEQSAVRILGEERKEIITALQKYLNKDIDIIEYRDMIADKHLATSISRLVCKDVYQNLCTRNKDGIYQVSVFKIYSWSSVHNLKPCVKPGAKRKRRKEWVVQNHNCQEKDNRFVKMIACQNSDGDISKSLDVCQCLNYADKDGKQYAYCALCKDVSQDNLIFSNREEINKNFVPHIATAKREEKVQQYYGYVIRDLQSKPLALLQIDTSTEGGLGESKEEIKKYAEKYIKPYINLLQLFLCIETLLFDLAGSCEREE